ncbi:MAG: RICIN domain-containing protein, partial [Paludibacteraceae bacterium]|nr:RICIN domain-containing protein [Paludibacteraceae bacterium]
IVPMLGQFNVHTYGGDIRDKANLKDLVTETRLPFWMSETGAGGNGLAGNLSLAQRMFDDLNYLQPQAWIDWQFVEENNDQWCMVKGNFSNQTYNIVKNFYVRMQVTRFIRQGYTMLGTGRNDILAAVSPSGDKVVVVMLNTATEEKNISIDLSLLKKVDGLAELYVTNSRLDCKRMADVEVVDGRVDYTMGGEEISTLVFTTEAGNGMENFTEGFPYLIVPRASTAPLTQNGGALQLSSLCVADSMQRWYFNKLDNGNYNIYTMLEGKKYALTDDGSYYLTTSQLDESNKGQQFKVEHIGDNSYKVISVSNDKLLDLEGEHLEIGTKVGLWQTGATGANVHREWRILSVPFTAVPMKIPTSVDATSSATMFVYAADGAIVIVSLEDSVVDNFVVYNIDGKKVANGTVDSAITRIHLGRGIYIVKYGKEAQTVIVK